MAGSRLHLPGTPGNRLGQRISRYSLDIAPGVVPSRNPVAFDCDQVRVLRPGCFRRAAAAEIAIDRKSTPSVRGETAGTPTALGVTTCTPKYPELLAGFEPDGDET